MHKIFWERRRPQHQALHLEKIFWKTCYLKWSLTMWRQQQDRTCVWKESCFYFKANRWVQKQHSINKEIQELCCCQNVKCNIKGQKNDGGEGRGQIMKTLCCSEKQASDRKLVLVMLCCSICFMPFFFNAKMVFIYSSPRTSTIIWFWSPHHSLVSCPSFRHIM